MVAEDDDNVSVTVGNIKVYAAVDYDISAGLNRSFLCIAGDSDDNCKLLQTHCHCDIGMEAHCTKFMIDKFHRPTACVFNTWKH